MKKQGRVGGTRVCVVLVEVKLTGVRVLSPHGRFKNPSPHKTFTHPCFTF